ncbi:hypothetical protein [Cognatilysobacter terrigena]|uniref:hypothetical protein n=1 Tax=Cognatilysobacter terrigena TaxID=2488749 RepID=UPI00105C079C|nr:hypothetical protein [Lysobacter terrigena]
MSNDKRVHDDGGYGNSNLVGSNHSGLDSAIEGRRAQDAARERAEREGTGQTATSRTSSQQAPSQDDSLGRLADRDTGRRMEGADSSAGIGTGASLGERTDLSGRGGQDGLEH